MNIKDLIAKGFIDLEDEISLEKKSEIMPLFGFTSYNSQSSFYQHPHEPGVHIWFPICYPDDTNEWENTHSKDWERAFEQHITKNAEQLAKVASQPNRQVRVMFAKLKPHGRLIHEFKGIYRFDPDLSATAKKAAYVRIATRATLYPV